jgi:hypothetical protein
MSEEAYIAFSAAVLGTPNACDFLRGFFSFIVTSVSGRSLSVISEPDSEEIWCASDE